MSGGDNPRASELTRHDRRRLAKALAQEPQARVFRRIQAVLFVAEGVSVSEAARRVRADRSAVHRWMDWYLRRHDPSDLADDPRTGRPARAERVAESVIGDALERDPREEGFLTTTWTVPLLATYLSRRTGQTVSERTLRRRLHELRYRWKRPRYVYTGQELNLAQKKGRLFAD